MDVEDEVNVCQKTKYFSCFIFSNSCWSEKPIYATKGNEHR